MQRIGGARRKTRKKFRKNAGTKGKISLSRYFQRFSQDDKVRLSFEPAVQKGNYFRRFHGKTGIVKGSQGDCMKVRIRDKGKSKELIVHPVHMSRL